MVELGAGTALPSLLAATGAYGVPALVTITDYPDLLLLANLGKNVEANRPSFAQGCEVVCEGYEWGKDVAGLM